MPNHFSDLGFRVTSQETFESLALRAADAGDPVPAPPGGYLVCRVGGGIELWVQTTPERDVCGCQPHFSGPARLRVGVTEIHGSEHNPLDGALVGWADPPEGDPEMGACPVRIDVPNFAAVKDALAPPRIVVMQVAAFAHWLDCFPSDEAFAASQDPKVRVAAESFFPTGLTPLDDGPAPNRAEALFSGHVLSVSPPARGEEQAELLFRKAIKPRLLDPAT